MLEAHPAAAAFPMMSRDELRALAEDIISNGQKEPVVLFGGKVLDGRNRVAACRIANVEPDTIELGECPSPVAFVRSKNLVRRHLIDAQKATIACDLKAMFQEEARARREAGGDRGRATQSGSVTKVTKPTSAGRAMDHAAALVGISTKTAYEMEAVKRTAPEVFEAAKAGEVRSVAQAKRMAAGEPEPPPRGKPEAATEASTRSRVQKSAAFDARVSALFSEAKTISEIAEELGCNKSKVQAAKKRLGYVTTKTAVDKVLDNLEEFADACGTMLRYAPWDAADGSIRAAICDAAKALKSAAGKIERATRAEQ